MATTLADAIALWENGWTAGETKTQAVSFDSSYPCSTHDLRYEFAGPGAARFSIDGSDTGTGFRVLIPAATTLPLDPGGYVYTAFATDTAGVVTCVDRGTVAIRPNLTRVTHAQRCLAAIRARIEGRATADQLTMSMGDVTLAYMTPSQLLEWEGVFASRCTAELNAAKAATGAAGASYRVLTEFQRP